ncbi:MAG: VOC family protein [Candidatus Dormibacteraeota bacterium]|nr:VOC family protein [Candidatus Dormibacteraeota bacterium]
MRTNANPDTWFEIPVEDIRRAQSFYEQVFGVRLDPLEMGRMKMAWFPRPENATGSSGGLVQAPGRAPSRKETVVFFNVPDIDSTLAAVQKNGGKVVMPKAGGGEHGAIAHFEDSEGNLVALFSNS